MLPDDCVWVGSLGKRGKEIRPVPKDLLFFGSQYARHSLNFD